MSRLYFIRHGQASFGGDNYDRLSETGRRQSQILGRYLARLDLSFDAVYSGSMTRQKETAEAVLAELPAGSKPLSWECWPEFNEYDSQAIFQALLPELSAHNSGLAELASRITEDRRAFQLVFDLVMQKWISLEDEQPDFESWRCFSERVKAGLGRVMAANQGGKTVAIFSSGGPLGVLMQLALNLSSEMALAINWQVRNASVSEFVYNEQQMSLLAFNGLAHLEEMCQPEMITYR